jgi:hypothetical protein
MNLHAEAVVAMGDAKQLRNRTRDASSEIVLLSWGDRLGFKTKLPLGPVPKPRPHHSVDQFTQGNGYLLDVKVHEA